MKTFNYVIKDELGIHARPAGLLVKEAGKFQSAVKIAKDGKEVDAKRVLGVMGLCVKCGQEVTVSVDGADENEAFEALEAFFQANL